jgi:hypothetical protein
LSSTRGFEVGFIQFIVAPSGFSFIKPVIDNSANSIAAGIGLSKESERVLQEFTTGKRQRATNSLCEARDAY